MAAKKEKELDPDAPITGILQESGLSTTQLGEAMGGLSHVSVVQAAKRGRRIGLDLLLRAAEAAGLEIRILARKKG